MSADGPKRGRRGARGGRKPDADGDAADAGRSRRTDRPDIADEGPADRPDMTRERARTERRDLDKERGEPVAGGAARGGPRALRPSARPLHDWTTPPRILITNDGGNESRRPPAPPQAARP